MTKKKKGDRAVNMYSNLLTSIMKPAEVTGVFLDGQSIKAVCLECRQCKVRTFDNITTETIYAIHGDHLESVTIEVEIIDTGEPRIFLPRLPTGA